ncbi:MAG TPA: hypothetical protein VGP76_22460 [Planctomycetaceae bacterium]|jgi:hypothetical protein|nr:hypothetical protein [Planctomycetaceae bacterium]
MTNLRQRGRRYLSTIGRFFLLVLIAPLLLVLLLLIVVLVAVYLLYGLVLQVAIWWFWCRKGRDVLIVYSESPIWRDYVEKRILPTIGDRAVVLNWSERRQWQRTLAVLAFRFFGGTREFNPMAVVFRPLHNARCFRFYKPFREFKHGDTSAVSALESGLFRMLGVGPPR